MPARAILGGAGTRSSCPEAGAGLTEVSGIGGAFRIAMVRIVGPLLCAVMGSEAGGGGTARGANVALAENEQALTGEVALASLGAMLAPRDQHREAAQAALLARCLANPRDGAEVPKAGGYTQHGAPPKVSY